MVGPKLGLKALSLCVLVLSLMFAATSGVAQAEPGSAWDYINPTTGSKEVFSKTLEANPIIEFEIKVSLLFTIGGGTKVTITCTGAEFDEGGQLTAEGSILLGRLKAKGCTTLLNGTVSKPCEPHNGAEKGIILTEKSTGLIVLKELEGFVKDPTVVLKPDTGTVLAKIQLGEECSIGEEIAVEGQLVLWDCKKSFSIYAITHLWEAFSLNLLHIGPITVSLSGSFSIKLGGAHANYQWAGLAS